MLRLDSSAGNVQAGSDNVAGFAALHKILFNSNLKVVVRSIYKLRCHVELSCNLLNRLLTPRQRMLSRITGATVSPPPAKTGVAVGLAGCTRNKLTNYLRITATLGEFDRANDCVFLHNDTTLITNAISALLLVNNICRATVWTHNLVRQIQRLERSVLRRLNPSASLQLALTTVTRTLRRRSECHHGSRRDSLIGLGLTGLLFGLLRLGCLRGFGSNSYLSGSGLRCSAYRISFDRSLLIRCPRSLLHTSHGDGGLLSPQKGSEVFPEWGLILLGIQNFLNCKAPRERE